MSLAQISACLSLYVSFNKAVPSKNVYSVKQYSNKVILIQSWSSLMVITYNIISPGEDGLDFLMLGY